MGRIKTTTIASLWVIPISILVNRIIPDPYMAQKYCNGDFMSWDPMNTTPPGLYYLSLVQVAALFPSSNVFRCSATVDFFEKESTIYPPMVNEDHMYGHVKKVATDLLGPSNFRVVPPMTSADEFSFYTQVVPAAFYYIGVRNEGDESSQVSL